MNYKTFLNILTNRVRGEPGGLNEAVNFEKEVIYIAIPKTGSTSIRNQLKSDGPHLIPYPHLDILQTRELIYTWLLFKSLGCNQAFPTSGVKDDSELRDEAQKVFDNFFKFTIVRNPWARTVSLFFRKGGSPCSDEFSFEDFCEKHLYASDTCLFPTKHKNQTDWFTDSNDKVLVDYVGKIESLDDSIEKIASLTNYSIMLKNIELNVNKHSKSKNYRDMYNQKTKNIIAQHFEKDIDLLKYTF